MQILDCTIRDGGYYSNWDFSEELIQLYIDSTNKLPLDYIEIGYRCNSLSEYRGEYFYCPEFVLKHFKASTVKKLAIMVDEKNVAPSEAATLLSPCKGIIDLVRIALDPMRFRQSLKLAEEIKKQGFAVGFNVMYMSKWKQNAQFLNELSEINGLADYFYLVDSYGGVYPKDVIEIIELVKERVHCPLGFHGHNNLELALINSLTALEHGVSIIDSTITGMGRGAGNLKTELLLTTLNSKYGIEVDFNALSKVVDVFEQLRQDHGWGTNLPYMVSGANGLPQKDVMNWVTQRFYSINSIIRALQNQKSGLKDNESFPEFKCDRTYSTAIIIGGGPNAAQHAKAVRAYVERHTNEICLIHASSKNAAHYQGLSVQQFFCLVGNEGHRLEQVFSSLGNFEGQCILPPYPRKMGTYVPQSINEKTFELETIHFTNKLTDTHTALALETAHLTGAQNILLVGYDGYQDQILTQQERSLSEENEFLFQAFSHAFELDLHAVTPTNYSTLKIQSIYQYLI